jgi:FlaA1/EpsC-like NDP-sugar epimerase
VNRAVVLRLTQVVIDLGVFAIALWLACFLRFEGAIPNQIFKRMLFMLPYVVAFQYALLWVAGVTRSSWRYVGLREAIRIFVAVAGAAAVFTAIRLVAAEFFSRRGPAQFVYLPLGVIFIDLALAYLGIVGVRVVRRVTVEQKELSRLRPADGAAAPVLLVGAGRAGLMVAKEIGGRPELGLTVVGFIDDDKTKHGSALHGVRVLGGIEDIERIARRHSVEQAIITIADAPGSVMRSIAEACRRAELSVKVIPGLYQIVAGRMNLTKLRDVAIEDLLRRDAVVLDEAAIARDLRGRVVLVTGAGGSVGSELCRQIGRFEPARVVLVERAENALFEIHRELLELHRGVAVAPCVADITDGARIEQILSEFKPEVVFHAAAHKHVPMMEWNPFEAIKNNVFGTASLANAARAHGVRSFVMISTDKAVNPTSVMGASKRAAEIYVQAMAEASETRFVTVRFGNVLGSNGSVVPIFREQIARGGPVTVTHPDMKRYFMTIPEACQLVLEAGAMGRGGEIFILDMGEPVKIVDLARDLIQLSGLSTDDIQIVFSGVRPGEKLYEELSIAEESVEKTVHPQVYVGRTVAESLTATRAKLEYLRAAVEQQQREGLFAALSRIVPEYQRESEAVERAASAVPPDAAKPVPARAAGENP